MADKKDAFENLPAEAKEDQIFGQLLLIDLGVADAEFLANYQNAKADTTDPSDSMRLDLEMAKRVGKLREEGKMLPMNQLKEKAKSMVDLKSSDLLQGFNDFRAERSQK